MSYLLIMNGNRISKTTLTTPASWLTLLTTVHHIRYSVLLEHAPMFSNFVRDYIISIKLFFCFFTCSRWRQISTNAPKVEITATRRLKFASTSAAATVVCRPANCRPAVRWRPILSRRLRPARRLEYLAREATSLATTAAVA